MVGRLGLSGCKGEGLRLDVGAAHAGFERGACGQGFGWAQGLEILG